MELLSVIIPVYNNKRYLKQCIDSIINQKYKNIEIILVDDGSDDGSDEICDAYKKINKRVQVIHQKNKGCMVARLRGLQRSKGKYIGFVDSDDWVDIDMYQILMSIAVQKDCDIVSMGYTAVIENETIEEDDATLFGYYEREKNLDIFLSNMMYDIEKRRRGTHPSLCTKVIKRELLIKEFSKVNKNISIGEDAAIFYSCCLNIKNIFIIRENKYYYRIHGESMCRNMSINSMIEIYTFYQYMKKRLLEYDRRYSLLKQLKNYIWTLLDQELQQVFKIQVGIAYIFPYTMIEKNSNIILYGAGEVGQAYYDQIMNNNYCNVVAWVDKNGDNRKNIVYPNQIIGLNYTRIVIAIQRKEIADEIITELISIGIEKEKILWVKPYEITASVR